MRSRYWSWLAVNPRRAPPAPTTRVTIGSGASRRRRLVPSKASNCTYWKLTLMLIFLERPDTLEEDRAERLGGPLEDLQLGIEAIGEAGRGGHHRDGAGRRVRDHVRERIEGRAARQPDRLRGARQAIAQRDRLGARGGQPEQHRNANPTRQVSHAAPPLAVAGRGGLPR